MNHDLSGMWCIGQRKQCSGDEVVAQFICLDFLQRNRATINLLCRKHIQILSSLEYVHSCIRMMEKEYQDITNHNKQLLRRLERILDENGGF